MLYPVFVTNKLIYIGIIECGCVAVQVDDDPVIVQLLFEPSGRPVDEQNYYMNEKDNVCVVCGTDESYIRKNIIPREYRKYVRLLHIIIGVSVHIHSTLCNNTGKDVHTQWRRQLWSTGAHAPP